MHIDIKKLARFDQPGHRVTGDRTGQSNSRGIGCESVHVCIDDHSRIAFLQAAVAYYQRLGVTVLAMMTDNGACYKSKDFAKVGQDLKIKHKHTRPYTPETNGKAERFIQTAFREWAYARSYQSSHQRAQHLPNWRHAYNWHRPHGSLKAKTPISRLSLIEDNLLRLHI